MDRARLADAVRLVGMVAAAVAAAVAGGVMTTSVQPSLWYDCAAALKRSALSVVISGDSGVQVSPSYMAS